MSKICPENIFKNRLLVKKTPVAFWYDHAVRSQIRCPRSRGSVRAAQRVWLKP